VSDSTQEPAGEDRPKRNQGARRDSAGGAARGGAPKRDGERRPTGERGSHGRTGADRDKKPYRREHGAGDGTPARRPERDGERRSYGGPSRDSDRKPYAGGSRDGERKSYSGSRDGERKPHSGGGRDAGRPYSARPTRDGERPAYGGPRRDGERKPYGDRDRSGARPQRDGERKPYGDRSGARPQRDGERKPYGDRSGARPQRDGERKPYGRPHQGADRRGRDGARAAERAPRIAGHGAAELRVRPRHDDPDIPERITPRDLDKAARSELKTLSKENAEQVARHLVAASEALEDDPLLAHRHALSAARRAGRVGVVRETLAITAYATGDFALALRELRTYRRITGRDDQLPLMVDSERGVGRPDRALELGRSVDRSRLSASVQAALAIAMSGARLDLGQPELALAELEVPQLDPDRAFSYSPALFSAYAEVLEELGRTTDAARWRGLAERADAALAGEQPDFIEVFEIDEEGSPVDPPAESGAAAARPGSTSSDPADAIEPEVAAVLAETSDLADGRHVADDEPVSEGEETDDDGDAPA
jgi:23S rRNA pseudouridine2605 synthase